MALAPLPLEVPPFSTIEQFEAGWREGGGEAWLLEVMEDRVIPCESSWNPGIVSPDGYLGLLQFSPSTWFAAANRTGLWDWADAYHQGYNGAVWASLTDPATQWGCF